MSNYFSETDILNKINGLKGLSDTSLKDLTEIVTLIFSNLNANINNTNFQKLDFLSTSLLDKNSLKSEFQKPQDLSNNIINSLKEDLDTLRLNRQKNLISINQNY
ncbi:hypothetical protein BN85404970 [Alteracholeplasma palmae J233]|uniref:Uncharacterized protein n=1 Tax=Alteracholeplasma palmae (strain ATCC 49389 / J233) TaxID=1318466 RepID=U4KK72_ALTPJ|nr:hypothetical protein [Alteracholeplasma palmae]CCV64074.1 hypothetical protein BN85404970 [Alteracholeplasma palmae J233]